MSTTDDLPLERIDCPVCGGDRFTTLFEKAGEPFSRCDGCRLVLINPRPRWEAILAGYDAGYSHTYTAKAEAKLARARRRVARVVRRRRVATGGHWLDVGCSAGFILAAASEAGFAVTGTDVEPAALAFARERFGLDDLHEGVLEALALPAASFDVITLFDVIEHVRDPGALLTEIRRLLRPDGLVEIRTPDVAHWRVPRRLTQWPEIKPSEHLYYFSRATLGRLLHAHGLAVRHRRPSLKPALDIFAGHA